MFFSSELLSRRDSGYALLWLAATVGSKLKKFPRRDVASANISQLSQLIVQPPEPLALRLSSNLMVGLVRVYKMKHELFEIDVGACVTSLKKSLHELRRVADNHNVEIVKHLSGDALNAPEDPAVIMALEFETMEDWDMVFRRIEADSSSREFDINESFIGQESSFNASDHSQRRKSLHQLDESHEHLLSSSFLKSLGGDQSIADSNLFSSINASDHFLDFDFGDGDVGLGEEMERDLAKAWNLKLDHEPEIPEMEFNLPGAQFLEEHNDLNFCNDALDANIQFFEHEDAHENEMPELARISQPIMTPPPDPPHTPVSALKNLTIGAGAPIRGILKISHDTAIQGNKPANKKRKKVVRLIDPRIELTDEELKFQRYNYPQEMARLRGELEAKKDVMRDGKRHVEEQLWAPPIYFAAPELVELWNHRVVCPVRDREAAWRRELEMDGEYPLKRRRVEPVQQNEAEETQAPIDPENVLFDFYIERQEENMPEFEGNGSTGDLPISNMPNPGDRYFSDEPELARHASGPSFLPDSSLIFRRVVDVSQGELGSNNLFPWDGAGPSLSSIASLPGSASRSELGLSFDETIVQFRRSSSNPQSRRESPAVSLLGDVDNDVIDVAINPQEGGAGEAQEMDNVVTLERNSFHFLEYAKMHQASNIGPLFFSDIVPVETSPPRVAAEGFYHCLALATKDLIRLKQIDAYGPIKIEIK